MQALQYQITIISNALKVMTVPKLWVTQDIQLLYKKTIYVVCLLFWDAEASTNKFLPVLGVFGFLG